MLGMASPFAQHVASGSAEPVNDDGIATPSAEPALAAPPGAPQAAARPLAGTMIGMPSPVLPESTPPPPAPIAAAPAQKSTFTGTMVGVVPPIARPTPLSPADQQATHHSPTPLASTQLGYPINKELQSAMDGQGSLGFALNQTASSGSFVDSTGASARSDQVPGGPKRFDGTLLGVAQPGIAPTPGAAAEAPPNAGGVFEPSDFPTVPDSPKSGVVTSRVPPGTPPRPLWQTVAFIGGGLLAAAGLGGFLAKMSKADAQVSVTRFSVDDAGRDQLELKCPQCPPGTTLRIQEATCKFEDHKCTLIVSQPLSLGQNEFELSLVAADGELLSADPLLVPVAFRMSSNWKGRQASPPFGEILVEAPAGSRIKVDGKPMSDQAGKTTYKVVLDAETLGESREAQKVAFDVPIEVTTGDKIRSTRASLRGVITPLQLTSVGPLHELSGKTLTISGLSSPGAKVRFGSTTTTANERGEFSLLLTHPDESRGFVEASTEEQLVRRAPLTLSRHASLPAPVITSFEEIKAPGFVQLDATVLESRVAAGVTRTLLEIQKDCGSPPCLLSTTYAEPTHLLPNRTVTVSGWATPGDPVSVKVVKFAGL